MSSRNNIKAAIFMMIICTFTHYYDDHFLVFKPYIQSVDVNLVKTRSCNSYIDLTLHTHPAKGTEVCRCHSFPSRRDLLLPPQDTSGQNVRRPSEAAHVLITKYNKVLVSVSSCILEELNEPPSPHTYFGKHIPETRLQEQNIFLRSHFNIQYAASMIKYIFKQFNTCTINRRKKCR